MEENRIKERLSFYRRHLLENVVPFWMNHSLDREYGGYIVLLDKKGTPYGTDKYVWFQGRELWMFSALYNRIEQRPEWLEAARLGADFLKRFGFDSNGRWNFHLTREGKIIKGPISIHSDYFGALGMGEYSQAAGDKEALKLALDTFWSMMERIRDPNFGAYYPRSAAKIRRHNLQMCILLSAQELNNIAPDPKFCDIINECLDQILYRHTRYEDKALYENLAMDFSKIDSPEGRLINPGHCLESAWFVMHQARRQNDAQIWNRATDIVEWAMERGWDDQYGGIFEFVDVTGNPPEISEWFDVGWSTKVWWVHAEALYALLLAYHLTHRPKLLEWFEKVHKWTFTHFPEYKYGEWYEYLYRDGQPWHTNKGTVWKGAFHVPRALLNCVKVLEGMVSGA